MYVFYNLLCTDKRGRVLVGLVKHVEMDACNATGGVLITTVFGSLCLIVQLRDALHRANLSQSRIVRTPFQEFECNAKTTLSLSMLHPSGETAKSFLDLSALGIISITYRSYDVFDSALTCSRTLPNIPFLDARLSWAS